MLTFFSYLSQRFSKFERLSHLMWIVFQRTVYENTFQHCFLLLFEFYNFIFGALFT